MFSLSFSEMDSQPLDLGFERTSVLESWLGLLRLRCKVTISTTYSLSALR